MSTLYTLVQKLLHDRPDVCTHIFALQRKCHRRLDKAGLAAAIVAAAVEGDGVKRLGAYHSGHSVG